MNNRTVVFDVQQEIAALKREVEILKKEVSYLKQQNNSCVGQWPYTPNYGPTPPCIPSPYFMYGSMKPYSTCENQEGVL